MNKIRTTIDLDAINAILSDTDLDDVAAKLCKAIPALAAQNKTIVPRKCKFLAGDRRINDDRGKMILEPRNFGPYANRAFYLNTDLFDFTIVRDGDDDESKVLVITRK